MVKSRRKAGEATETKLLDSAREIFIEKGFSGASMGAIARHAEMNQSLIYHYYPSKEDLWNRIKEDLLTAFIKKDVSAPETANLSFEKVVDALFVSRIEYYADNPEVVRLFKWQSLEDAWGKSPRQREYLDDWISYIRKLQEAKKVRSDIQAEEILTLILGSGWAVFSQQPNPLVSDKAKVASYVKNIKKLLLESLSL